MELTHEWIGVFFDPIKGNCSFVLHVDVKEESEDPDDAWNDADLPMA